MEQKLIIVLNALMTEVSTYKMMVLVRFVIKEMDNILLLLNFARHVKFLHVNYVQIKFFAHSVKNLTFF